MYGLDALAFAFFCGINALAYQLCRSYSEYASAGGNVLPSQQAGAAKATQKKLVLGAGHVGTGMANNCLKSGGC